MIQSIKRVDNVVATSGYTLNGKTLLAAHI